MVALVQPHASAQKATGIEAVDVVVTIEPGGQVFDDGLGSYTHKEAGNRCQIELGTGDLFFQTDAYNFRGTRRQAGIDLNSPAGTSVAAGAHQSASFFFSTDRIWGMAVSETKQEAAGLRFMATSNMGPLAAGTLYWVSFGGFDTSSSQSTKLAVTRLSATEWRVQAPPGTIGEVSFLGKRGGYQHRGNYYIQFDMTIVCPTCA